MQTFGRQLHRWTVLTAICLITFANSGCILIGGFGELLVEYVTFWEAPVPIPVSAFPVSYTHLTLPTICSV